MMKEGAEALATAVKEKKWADVKKAAGKMNTSCSECHSVFRD
jgi:cytochrome c556